MLAMKGTLIALTEGSCSRTQILILVVSELYTADRCLSVVALKLVYNIHVHREYHIS